jgi:peptidoglycan L-alanyl-D-glutamate endopeptidase CwlK
MPHFGTTSLAHLRTADRRLQSLAHEVIKYMDHTILCGHRGKQEQDEAVRNGKSKTPWPTSKHNRLPSKAIDVAPYPIDWDDEVRFARLMGHYERVAMEQGIKIRLGLDFNQNGRSNDEKFLDFPHIELVE